MKTTIAIRCTATLLVFSICLTAQAEPVSVLGPLESVSPNGKSITVLGQTYSADIKEFSSSPNQAAGGSESLFLPPIGTYVAVHGERNTAGDQIAVSVRALRNRYVSGATDVYLQGVAAAYDATVAVAQIGNLQVYLGDIGGESLDQGQGAMLEIVGRQSQPGGMVWATAVRVVRPAPASTQSITGTGVSAQSITGTGASTQSITGTGISAQSITGTGASTQSITGTGISAQSITGTGASTQSITGTGASTQSITGTGVSAQSITGTGSSTQSITGTGVSAQSITGTGKIS